jgi:acyl-CoA reductase-like NAD-dependent aldehyde dehydrogenase
MERAENFIGGKWSWPEGSKEIVSVNPADTREVICVAPDSPAGEVGRAVEEETPMCSVAFVRTLEEAGVPAGVVNLAHGYGESAGRALVLHDGVRLISFTGSTEVIFLEGGYAESSLSPLTIFESQPGEAGILNLV